MLEASTLRLRLLISTIIQKIDGFGILINKINFYENGEYRKKSYAENLFSRH